MPHKFKPGDTVRQIMPAPIEGRVIGYSLDQSTGDVALHVAWKVKDDAGEEHVATRYFNDDQVEKIADAEPVAEEAVPAA